MYVLTIATCHYHVDCCLDARQIEVNRVKTQELQKRREHLVCRQNQNVTFPFGSRTMDMCVPMSISPLRILPS